MLIKEARWLGKQIKELPFKENSIFLNFGSQSESYNKNNSHIYELINIIKENHILKNLDIISGKDIDYSGDILDDIFFHKIKMERFDCILLCNVLEHVPAIETICKRVNELLFNGGFIIFSGPYDYPKHLDPIDNGFRPGVEDVVALFPDFKFIDGEIITDYTYRHYLINNPKRMATTILRILIPFYKYNKWKNVVVPKFAYWNKNYKTTCVVLQKS
jgi:SAM-dependent methyltransferase